MTISDQVDRTHGLAGGIRVSFASLGAILVFAASFTFYVLLLFPGLGGEMNSGDSAKFQILGHTQIMLHGPGYPFVQLLGALVRLMDLPLPPWWTMTVVMAVIPAAIANTVAFLFVHHLTKSRTAAVAAALLLGSAELMAVQATEAEVYPLALAFILTTLFLLALFVETRKIGYFLVACAVYSLSFGNHLMMIMLVPLFACVTALHFRLIVQPRNVAIVAAFILAGASQYLYLALVAYSPDTAYSEYMPLPPEPMELVDYVRGTYFADLYGSGLASTRTLQSLIVTLRSAHPWVSAPLIVIGLVLFAAGWSYRDRAWYGLAVLYGGALAFTPFMLWYGAYDIRAFHLPVLGPLLVASVAAHFWFLARYPRLRNAVAVLFIAIGVFRAAHVATALWDRQPLFEGLEPAIARMIEEAPVKQPLFAMAYPLRMATLYHELTGDLPSEPMYRVWWRAVPELDKRSEVGGIVVPTDGFQFVHWIEHKRPELKCQTRKVSLPEGTRWPAYSFTCGDSRRQSQGSETLHTAAPLPDYGQKAALDIHKLR